MQKYNQKKIVKLNKNQIKNATQTKYIPKCHVKYSFLLIICIKCVKKEVWTQ